MEFTHLNPTESESSDDTSSKKEKKTKKHISHVPVPVQIEAARAVPPEAVRAMQELTEESANKKRKRAKKKVGHTATIITGASDEKLESVEGEEAEDDTAPTKNIEKSEESEKLEESDTTEVAEKTVIAEELSLTPEVEPLTDSEFLGELFISDRARRQQEALAKERAAAMKSMENEIDEEEDADRRLLQELAEQLAAAEAAGEVLEEAEDDESEEAVVSSISGTTSSTPTTTTTSSKPTPSSSPPPPPPPPIPPAFTPSATSGGAIPPVPVMAAAAGANILTTPASAPIVEATPSRRAERRGLLTGLLVGGVIEHVRHKRRERRMDKEHAEQIKRLTGEERATALRIAEKEKAALQTQTSLEKQLTRLKERVMQPAAMQAAERPVERVAERDQAVKKAENRVEQPKPRIGEKTPEDAAKAREKLEQAWAAEQAAIEKQREIPDDVRIEKSAWHDIEVDKKTGKALETPTVAYGQEFVNEQHQEKLRREIEEASLASANMRERYVDPHTAEPKQQQLGSAMPTEQYAASKSSSKKSQSGDDDGIEIGAIDIILWAILIGVVIAIISTLA